MICALFVITRLIISKYSLVNCDAVSGDCSRNLATAFIYTSTSFRETPAFYIIVYRLAVRSLSLSRMPAGTCDPHSIANNPREAGVGVGMLMVTSFNTVRVPCSEVVEMGYHDPTKRPNKPDWNRVLSLSLGTQLPTRTLQHVPAISSTETNLSLDSMSAKIDDPDLQPLEFLPPWLLPARILAVVH